MNIETIQQLNDWKYKGGKIAIYCAGLHGISFKRLLENIGIFVDLFLDNDNLKIGTKIDDVACVRPTDISGANDYVCIVCARIDCYKTIIKIAEEQGIIEIVDYRLILDDLIRNYNDIFLDIIRLRYYEPSADIFYSNINTFFSDIEDNTVNYKERIAVYTGSFGNYDAFFEPLSKPDNIDYYFISDNKPVNNSVYTWVDSRDIVPSEITSPIKKNRYVKLHPHFFFPEYKYSLYIDANIQIIGDINKLFHTTPSGIAVPRHWRRDCLYYEAMTVVNYKRVMPDDVIRQIQRYYSEGFPLHYGLAELCVIAREHNKPKCIHVMETWWNEFDKEAQRDQLSFPYALWKNDILMKDVAILGNNIRGSKFFRFHEHFANSENIKNDKK